MRLVLEPEALYPDTALEAEILGPTVRLLRGGGEAGVESLPDEHCAEAEGLFVFRNWLPGSQLHRFPKLKVVVRMGVGYDRLDRPALAERGITVCNIPDYGTAEVADHAIALVMALRRGLLLHHDLQRGEPSQGLDPAEWRYLDSPLVQRPEAHTFGILGLGRIGTAAALRAKAFGYRVIFHDPYLPNGVDRALGITRIRSLPEFMAQTNTLSIHAPLTRTTAKLVDEVALRQLPRGAVVVNTARGPILDLDGLERCLRDDHLAGAGLDVLPVEPPAEPPHPLLAAYRAREPWLTGRLIVTPHSAFHTPHAWQDIRVKSAETMRDVLLDGLSSNVIPPDAD
ncbi:C-terminal binding protein [Teichococcus vastitatis]|jgi:C-terminal binding protein|uniref:C-terminal binding protein n=1 Tax=Teichococcus vastitatis TaxID=2307076 RepID=A0ABS9WBU5_9PROT|nr:C-terminal binding protein [Pseudoroseomonas vastitatis]MCI0756771.1 C-terminal binding protein [Pseudoroseomonas vastitatis]